MRRVVAFLVVLAALVPMAALASFESSQKWFDQLSEADRNLIQADLILLGHYDHRIDGKFGQGTFEAISAFQKTQDRNETGVLTEVQFDNLRNLADKRLSRLGMRQVEDQAARVSMNIPANLLTVQSPTEQGTSYVSADGEISLETMFADLTDQSFRDLYEVMVAPDPERIVSYSHYEDAAFVVTGTVGAYSFYSRFIRAGQDASGYSLAWGKSYAKEGPVSSIWIASHFEPSARLRPAEQAPTIAEIAPPAQGRSAFALPAHEPDVISLNAEIDGRTPSDFDRALDARPNATTLVLNSPGGAVDSALVVAQEVKRRGMKTYVPDGMGCYSACAYIFFAGQNREVDGELGVHQISQDVADVALAQVTLGDVLDAFNEFGVNQQVISYMLRTPPDSMYVFSALELTELDINRGAPIQVAVTGDSPVTEPSRTSGGVAAFVQISSRSSRAEADRSLSYVESRWGSLFDEARAEIETSTSGQFRVRVPLGSLERANTICSAIKADGGGCYVTTPDN